MQNVTSPEKPIYKDYTRPVADRVADIISKMTLEEKISQMMDQSPAIERLDIPEYNWWNECLHGVARAGIATVFPQAIGLAATWNTDLMYQVADITSTEARAKHHEALRNDDYGRYKGLTFWSPNINIFRDPRWGRGQETYGEDPYLTSRLGVAFVKGLQGEDPKYFKVIATPKHFAVHSGPEKDRHQFDAITNKRDLWETYLPAFEACIKEGKAHSIMGAYNRYLGEACCASDLLLNKILRKQWKFEGYVVSDCGAIGDIFYNHKIAQSKEDAAASAVKNGCDLNCGCVFSSLYEAVKIGLITEAEIDISLERLFTARFKLGMFDPPLRVHYAQIPYSLNDTPEHREAALRAARESMVLLKNENHFLPLEKNIKTLAIIGPNANNIAVLLGNYNGTPSKAVTPLEGIRDKVSPETQILYSPGCELVDTTSILEPVPGNLFHFNGKRGLTGQYFDNTKLEGQPVYMRQDEIIDFDWSCSEPAPGLKNENFSVRWRGEFTVPQSGVYFFGLTGDDGYRLYINDRLVISNWDVHSVTTTKGCIELKEGQVYGLCIEFFQGSGGAQIKLTWGLPNQNSFNDAVAMARQADAVVFVGGISPSLEGEEMEVKYPGFDGGDRTDINLPQIQEDLLEALHATGKPVILVLLSGSALAINWANDHIPAIIQAWYPGEEGGTAIADVLFGDYNPAGRLPVTFYKTIEDLPPFKDYNMTGRTYRYFKGDALYPFGYGLSYSTFKYSNIRLSKSHISTMENVTLTIDVKNISNIAGDEVVQLYIRDIQCTFPAPLKSLKKFKRIHLKAGEMTTVSFKITPETLSLYNNQGEKIIEPGEFELMVGGSSTVPDLQKISLFVKSK